jgi:hypothetical protein
MLFGWEDKYKPEMGEILEVLVLVLGRSVLVLVLGRSVLVLVLGRSVLVLVLEKVRTRPSLIQTGPERTRN